MPQKETPMRFLLFLLSLLFVPVLVLAQEAPPDLGLDAGAVFAALLQAVRGGQWGLVAVLAFVSVIWVLRKGGAKFVPWLGTDEGGTWLTFGTVAAGVLGAAALAGTPITWLLVGKAFAGAATVGGAWSMGRRLLRSLVPLIARIPKVGPLLAKLLGFLAGADMKAAIKAEADKTYRPQDPPPTAAEADAQLFKPRS
jgi:hypothetical protein